MKAKVVLAPYGVYVTVYEVVHEGVTYWFTEKALREARRCVRTHDGGEDAEPEPLEDWVYKASE